MRGMDGYMQSFGAPGMIKINTAWFAHREHGRFAGIFGFMINLGRFGIFKIGPALLAGFTFPVLISFTAHSTHSLHGTASAMDIGGRKMAGFASGLIDSFQYFGGRLPDQN